MASLRLRSSVDACCGKGEGRGKEGTKGDNSGNESAAKHDFDFLFLIVVGGPEVRREL